MSSSRPTVAPWVHFTSSAKISSCGLVSTLAPSLTAAGCGWSAWRRSSAPRAVTNTLPLNTAARPAVQHALVDLPAPAVGLVVIDGGVVVHHLLAAGEVETVHQGLDVLVVEPDVQVVPGERAAHRQRERAIVAVALLVHVGAGRRGRPARSRAGSGCARARRPRAADDLGDRVGPVGLPAASVT